MWTTALASTTDGSAYLTVHFSPLLIILCTCKCSSTSYLPSIYNQISRRQVMQMTRLEDLTPSPSMTLPIEHSSRPTLGFPLGTALLLLVIFALSGMFSMCYHWDKLRSLLRSRHPALFEESEHTAISIGSSPSKTTSDHKLEKVGKECGLPVIMPGDKVPKFFARPCPHETCLPEAQKTGVPLETKCSGPSVSICIHESTVSC
ncbi:uncharacterized protein At5g65660-like [Miscanthus floridulus]|uniref:uncharacterized protein At5g65660-like n=1 Tax=Miscanthus floridulus TaxID=154761 RepID=UPI0034590FAA